MIKNEKVEWKKLGEVFYTRTGYTPSKKSKKFWSNGTVNWFTIEDIRNRGRLLSFANQKITSEAVKKEPFKKNSLVLSTIATIGEYALIDVDFVINQQFMVFTKKEEYENLVNMKFMYYYFSKISKFCIRNKRVGNVPTVDNDKILNYYLPIPSLKTQEKIVEYLDEFTKHILTLKEELFQRNKQYEFYRDKLLSEEHLNKIVNKYDLYKYELKETTLGEVIKLKNGRDWKTLNEGDIPVYGSGGPMNIGVNKFSYDKETVLIPRKGSIDNIFYLNEPFWNVDTIYYTEVNTKLLNVKYFYYFMKNIDLISLSINPTRPSLTQEIINNIKITLPPIEIQAKIAEILDKFQALTQYVSGLLPDEIEKREKQYEYYREKLLSFDTQCTSGGGGYHLLSKDYIGLLTKAGDIVGVKIFELEKKKLEDVCDFRRGSFPQPYGNNEWYGGIDSLPFVQVGDMRDDGFELERDTKNKISKLAQGMSVFVKKGTVLVSLQGTIGRVCISQYDSYVDRTIAIFNDYHIDINKKYFAYQLKNVFNEKKAKARGSTLKTITKEEFRDFKILIPPLPIQEYIVSILDKFEALSQSTTEGLRREIELREKQYEYYREKLLTFEK